MHVWRTAALAVIAMSVTTPAGGALVGTSIAATATLGTLGPGALAALGLLGVVGIGE